MDTIIEAKVPYTLSYIKRCRRSLCPVQADSECAQEKYSELKNESLESSEGVEGVESQKVPGVYCSVGATTCSDLNFNRQCICYTCPIWEGYELDKSTPIMYLCSKGRAN